MPEQRQVDFQPREEHQQQHADFGEELQNGMLRGKDVEHVRPEQHASQQQPDRLGQSDAARQARNDDDQHHAEREPGQGRQGFQRLMEILEHRHAACAETPYFGNMNCTCARICQSGPLSGVTTL